MKKNIKIKFQMIFIFMVILTTSTAISLGTCYFYYNRMITDKLEKSAIQTLESTDITISSEISEIVDYMKLIMLDKDFQKTMVSIDKTGSGELYSLSRKIYYMIRNLEKNFHVYIFNQNGKRLPVRSEWENNRQFMENKSGRFYLVNEDTYEVLSYQTLKNSDAFKELMERKESIITYQLDKNEMPKNIYLMRKINSSTDLSTVGVMVVIIPLNELSNLYEDIELKKNVDIMMSTKEGKTLSDFKKAENRKLSILSDIARGEKISDYKNKRMVTSLFNETYGYRLVVSMNYEDISREFSPLLRVYMMTFLLNIVCMLLAILYICRLIFNPINKLKASMVEVENGIFNRVRIGNNDEIGELASYYNVMIQKIEELIEKSIEEQDVKRKAELAVMIGQIKPHFLYNALETARSLCLYDDKEKISQMLQALAQYYRDSISKGNDVISLKTEVDIAKNYLLIQKIRYEDMIEYSFDVAEDTNDFMIPKLILQPLIENSIYHGIRDSGVGGMITVKAWKNDSHVFIIIEDNGIGMEQSLVNEIMNDKTDKELKSIGMRGTIRRLRIYYNCKDIIEVNSEMFEGTQIILKLPLDKGGKDETFKINAN